MGLYGKPIDALVVSGTNLFAGTWYDEGIYLSTDNGASWTPVNTGLVNPYWVHTDILCMAVSGTNLFAGTWDGGVFLSTNNGTSWAAVDLGPGGWANNVRTLAVSGTNLFAGTQGGGVYLSTNNGTSWTAVNTGLTSRF